MPVGVQLARALVHRQLPGRFVAGVALDEEAGPRQARLLDAAPRLMRDTLGERERHIAHDLEEWAVRQPAAEDDVRDLLARHLIEMATELRAEVAVGLLFQQLHAIGCPANERVEAGGVVALRLPQL